MISNILGKRSIEGVEGSCISSEQLFATPGRKIPIASM
jgi:hypothetical protein